VRLIYSTLVNQILNQTANGIVSQRRNQARVQAEAAVQAARDVVLAATFPDLKSTRGLNPPVAGIETKHDLTEAHQIPAAVIF